MASGNAHSPSYTYSLNQCDEASLASLYSILRGEKPLLPDDRAWIKDVASDLTHEITLAEEHITRLQAHCTAARQHLALYDSALAPIRGLPRDVLVSIFEHTFDEDYWPIDVGKPPWTLGQVCHSWRDIVVSSSSLWAIVKYKSEHDTRDTATEVVQEYLRRSGQHPLTVVLEGEYHAPVYDLILKEYHRWKLLYMEFINSSFASCLSSLPESIMQLEELYIMEAEDEDCNVFLQAPRLKRVWVPDYTGLRLLSSMEHVTHYAAQQKISEWSTLSDSLSPSLIMCHIELCDSASSDLPPLIHNSHLKTLEIWDAFALLNRLMLPALTTLCIQGHEDVPLTAAASIVQAFIQRSSCNLTTLVLKHSDHYAIAYLQLPGLESLIHLHVTLSFPVLETYCQRNSSHFASARILPRLSTLTITFDNAGRRWHFAKHQLPSWPAFVKALEERYAAGRLAALRIAEMHEVSRSWIIEDLVALGQRTGLCVEFITPSVQDDGLFWGREFQTATFWDLSL